MSKKKLTVLVLIALVAIGVGAWLWLKRLTIHSDTSPSASSSKPVSSTKADSTTHISQPQYSTTDPASLWVVVNKLHDLPSSYVPSNLVTPAIPLRLAASAADMHLRAEAASAVEKLVGAGRKKGIALMLVSGYRSYANQTQTYNGYAARDGVAAADTYSARPGHSEHQTGLAADLGNTDGSCQLEACFGTTAAGKWLAVHAHEYGFIIRYQKGTQAKVGYTYEPWHIRFLGTELATAVYNSGKTLEEYFGLPPAPDYAN